jgi:hypothetical protein
MMMKKGTKLAVATLFAAAMLFGTNCYAQTFPFVAAGSSAAFNALAFAGEFGSSPVCGPYNWTAPKTGGSGQITGHDNRGVSSISDVNGTVWVEWNTSNGSPTGPVTTVCAYLNIDSIVGNRLFFAQPQGSLVFTAGCPSGGYAANTPNQVPLLPADITLPQTVCNALNNHAVNAAPSDIRAEDAAFGTQRACSTYASGLTGLGYGGSSSCLPGNAINSAFSTGSAQPVYFNIVAGGKDPITGDKIPASTTLEVGGQILLVLANTSDTATGGLGTAAFNNVDRWVLAETLNGSLTRTRDLIPSSGLPSVPLTVILREPLSGTMNTIEFQITRNDEIASSQEYLINPNGGAPSGWTGTTNPLNITYTKSGGKKMRAIGTGEMTKEIGLVKDALGYAFFSYGNVSGIASTAKYLAVDGVDPLYADYASNPNGPGVLPTCTVSSGSSSCSGAITFPNIQNGSYPIWNVLRVITASPAPAGVSALVSAAQTYASSFVPDFVPFANLSVFRSHYNAVLTTCCGATVVAHNGHTKTAESGSDVGGAVFTIQSDLDHIADTNLELVQHKQ